MPKRLQFTRNFRVSADRRQCDRAWEKWLKSIQQCRRIAFSELWRNGGDARKAEDYYKRLLQSSLRSL